MVFGVVFCVGFFVRVCVCVVAVVIGGGVALVGFLLISGNVGGLFLNNPERQEVPSTTHLPIESHLQPVPSESYPTSPPPAGKTGYAEVPSDVFGF